MADYDRARATESMLRQLSPYETRAFNECVKQARHEGRLEGARAALRAMSDEQAGSAEINAAAKRIVADLENRHE